VRGSTFIRWVKVPLSPGLGDSYPNLGVMPQGLMRSIRRQGVHREVKSEGLEEKYRAVVKRGYPDCEPVGQRWGKVEPAVWRRRRSSSPIVPRCVRTARYGR
jgi:hypothetical protein